MRHVRVPVFCSPLDEFLVFGEHGINHLIEDVVSRLAEERGVRVQRLRGFSIESRNVPQDLFPAGPRFDERHPTLLLTLKCVRNAGIDLARFPRRSAR
jgi:hypothetical protein